MNQIRSSLLFRHYKVLLVAAGLTIAAASFHFFSIALFWDKVWFLDPTNLVNAKLLLAAIIVFACAVGLRVFLKARRSGASAQLSISAILQGLAAFAITSLVFLALLNGSGLNSPIVLNSLAVAIAALIGVFVALKVAAQPTLENAVAFGLVAAYAAVIFGANPWFGVASLIASGFCGLVLGRMRATES